MRVALIFLMAIVTSAFVALPATAQAQAQAASSDNSAAVYKPPMRGAPSRRVGGATRGSGNMDMVLHVLAPDQTGLTSQAQPTLYWYASKPTNTLIELTLISDDAELPVLSKNFQLTPGGVQAINLASYGVTLAPDTEYEWFVSVVSDTNQRSKDMTSGGTIRRVAPDPAVQAKVAAASERAVPGIYAEAGFWYDALGALSRLIDRNPGDAELRAMRAGLLEQIGLSAAAAYDLATRR